MAAALPKIAPQLCRAVQEPPTGSGWLHEIKYHGHRIIATVERGRVRLVSRPGNDATRRFAPIATWLGELPVRTAIIDGEAAVPDERGVTHIDHLNAARHAPERPGSYEWRLGAVKWVSGELV
jgi:bifunctional non-homologous end joining protein LigD